MLKFLGMITLFVHGLALAQSHDVIEAFNNEISHGTVFKIKEKNPQCPSMIRIKEVATEDGKKWLDLSGYELDAFGLVSKSFTHENHRFIFDPSKKIENMNYVMKRDCEWQKLGCRSEFQMTRYGRNQLAFHINDNLNSFGSAKHPAVDLSYQAKSRELKYSFRAFGITDFSCSYAPDNESAAILADHSAKQIKKSVSDVERSLPIDKSSSTQINPQNRTKVKSE